MWGKDEDDVGGLAKTCIDTVRLRNYLRVACMDAGRRPTKTVKRKDLC